MQREAKPPEESGARATARFATMMPYAEKGWDLRRLGNRPLFDRLWRPAYSQIQGLPIWLRCAGLFAGPAVWRFIAKERVGASMVRRFGRPWWFDRPGSLAN